MASHLHFVHGQHQTYDVFFWVVSYSGFSGRIPGFKREHPWYGAESSRVTSHPAAAWGKALAGDVEILEPLWLPLA